MRAERIISMSRMVSVVVALLLASTTARAADWSLTFSPPAVASYLEPGSARVRVVAATAASLPAARALVAALVEIGRSGSSLDDVATGDDLAILRRDAGATASDAIAVVRVVTAYPGATIEVARVVVYGANGAALTELRAVSGSPLVLAPPRELISPPPPPSALPSPSPSPAPSPSPSGMVLEPPAPPPAPRAPAMPPPITSSTRVTVVSSSPGTELWGREEIEDAEWHKVCDAPCERTVSTKRSYRIEGDGISPSSRFVLLTQRPALVLTVSPGSDGARLGSYLAFPVAGVLGTLAAWLPSADTSTRLGLLAASGGAALIGFILHYVGRTSVTF